MNFKSLFLLGTGFAIVAAVTGPALSGSDPAAAPVVLTEPEAAPVPESGAAPVPEGDAATVPVPVPTVATVYVTVENVEPGRGNVWLALCDTSLSVEGCPDKLSVPASSDVVEVTFNDVRPGVYAVAGYQDLNGDDEFDKILGMPREPYALSGAAGDMLVPTFEDAALPFDVGDNKIVIHMRGIGG